MESEAQARRSNISGQFTLFGDETVASDTEMALPDIAEYDKKEILRLEKESAGMYFSGHIIDTLSTTVAKEESTEDIIGVISPEVIST